MFTRLAPRHVHVLPKWKYLNNKLERVARPFLWVARGASFPNTYLFTHRRGVPLRPCTVTRHQGLQEEEVQPVQTIWRGEVSAFKEFIDPEPCVGISECVVHISNLNRQLVSTETDKTISSPAELLRSKPHPSRRIRGVGTKNARRRLDIQRRRQVGKPGVVECMSPVFIKPQGSLTFSELKWDRTDSCCRRAGKLGVLADSTHQRSWARSPQNLLLRNDVKS